MSLTYLQFHCPDGLKKFRRELSIKKVYILLNQKVLLAEFSDTEIKRATQNYEACIVEKPSVECY